MIRPATHADLPAMLAIYAPYVLDTTITFDIAVPTEAEFCARFDAITAQFPWLVWEEDGRILGYAYGSAPYSRAAYRFCAEDSIYLAPDARGRGIGTALYGALEKILFAQGYQMIYALITEENSVSVAFHEKQGYHTVAVFPDCGYKFDRVLGVRWMEKRQEKTTFSNASPISWPEFVNDYQF